MLEKTSRLYQICCLTRLKLRIYFEHAPFHCLSHSWQVIMCTNQIWPDLAFGFVNKRSGYVISWHIYLYCIICSEFVGHLIQHKINCGWMRYTILIQFIQMNSKVILKKCDYLCNHQCALTHVWNIFLHWKWKVIFLCGHVISSIYHINTNGLPGKLSHVKITFYFHMWKDHCCYGLTYIINCSFFCKKTFKWNGLGFHWCLLQKCWKIFHEWALISDYSFTKWMYILLVFLGSPITGTFMFLYYLCNVDSSGLNTLYTNNSL